MLKAQIKVGGYYSARVSGNFVTVRVDRIEERTNYSGRAETHYFVTNLKTGRSGLRFRSAAKFRGEAKSPVNVLRQHVTGAIERGEAVAIVEQPVLTAAEECKRDAQSYVDAEAKREGEHCSDPTVVVAAGSTPVTSVAPRSIAPSGSGLAARLIQRQTETDTAPHIVVKALAGTGKTFTQIVGVAWAFGQSIWPEIVHEMAIRRGADPETFEVIPSPQQQAVWDSLALSAGKVRTVTYCAFNKSIVTEFGEQWGWLVTMLQRVGVTLQFATVNSLGSKAMYKAFGRLDVKTGHVENLIAEELGRDIWELRRDKGMQGVLSATDELVGLCKLTLAGWSEADGFDSADVTEEVLDEIVAQYDVEIGEAKQRAYSLVPKVLERCLDVKRNRVIDFNDQNWIPVVLNLPVDRVGLLLIDEGQDLPRCKQEFGRRAGSRVGLVGDVNQAIYHFAGADSDSIPRMERLLGVTEPLSLTQTRRCGKAIVAEARKIVAEFEAHESNCDGSVREMPYKGAGSYHSAVEDGDMVICRTNAPLVSQALHFLKAGRKVVLRGRDFGGQLLSFVKKMEAKDPADLIAKVEVWAASERKKENAKRNPSEGRLMAIDDRQDCVSAFCDGAKTTQDVIDKIDLVFAGKSCPRCKKHFNESLDTCPEYHCKTIPNPVTGWKEGPKLLRPEGILFSSIHRAKGLESGRVFFLMPKGGECPHPMAKTAEQKRQEWNCLYIGITRAIRELVYVREVKSSSVRDE